MLPFKVPEDKEGGWTWWHANASACRWSDFMEIYKIWNFENETLNCEAVGMIAFRQNKQTIKWPSAKIFEKYLSNIHEIFVKLCRTLQTRTWPSVAPMVFSRRMKDWGFRLKKSVTFSYDLLINDKCIFSFRGLFVIDKAGTLRQITINDLPVGRDVDETLRLVQVIFLTSHYLRLETWSFDNWDLEFWQLWKRSSCKLKYHKMSSRLSSLLMSMVRCALLAGGLVRKAFLA